MKSHFWAFSAAFGYLTFIWQGVRIDCNEIDMGAYDILRFPNTEHQSPCGNARLLFFSEVSGI